MLSCRIVPNSKTASTASACASERAQTPCTIIARIKFLAKVEAADAQLHVVHQGPFKEYLGDFRRPNELQCEIVRVCTSIHLVKSLLFTKVLTAEIPLAPVGRGDGLRLSHTSALVAFVSGPNFWKVRVLCGLRRPRVKNEMLGGAGAIGTTMTGRLLLWIGSCLFGRNSQQPPCKVM